MTTVEERREVARRLREYVDIPDDWWADTYSGFYVEKCVFGDVERHRESELFVRLADLIDPDTTNEQTNHDDISLSASPIDRDALLELAEVMQDYAAICQHEDCREHIEVYARRIREALGVER